MICNAKPYEGTDAFVFISYARKDAGVVYPLLERLASAGVRLWYDSGIHGGEIWPEVIAEHLNRCVAFLAFISRNAVDSHSCYSELTFAIEAHKPMIIIRYDDAQMTPGMRLMTNAVQRIEMKKTPSDSDISAILSLDSIKPAHGIADRSIAIQDYCLNENAKPVVQKKWDPKPVIPASEEPEPQPAPQQNPVSEVPEPQPAPVTEDPEPTPDGPVIELTEPVPPAEKPAPVSASSDPQQGGRRRRNPNHQPVTDPQPVEDPNEKTTAEDWEDPLDKTIADGSDDDLERTIAAPVDVAPVIVLLPGGGKKFRGKIGATILGRSQKKADVVIIDPERKISNTHVRIISFEGEHFVEDLNSTNGTWLDGIKITGGEKMPVEDSCELLLHRTRLLVAFAQEAESLWTADSLLFLRCEESGECRYLWQGEMTLGRTTPWNDNVLNDKKVSHKHAIFRIVPEGCVLKDESTNGTFVNGNKMEKGTEQPLQTGDIVQIGNWHFVVTVINFSGGEQQ